MRDDLGNSESAPDARSLEPLEIIIATGLASDVIVIALVCPSYDITYGVSMN